MTERPEREGLAVVLVRARNPLNIGAVARAMQNFGVRDLRLVEVYEDSYREARSAVGAGAVLEGARVFASVAEAVADCRLVLGTTTARRRELAQPVMELEEAAAELEQQGTGQVALLFGSEKHGLTSADLDLCHALVRIRTAADQPSMNLGQAAAVCLWELVARQPQARQAQTVSEPVRAESGQLDRFEGLLMELLEAGGYLDRGAHPQSAATAEQELRRMLRRLHVTERDTVVLMGMVRRLLWRLRHGGEQGDASSPPGAESGLDRR